MKRNILDEAVENAKRISDAAMANARTQLTEAFSTNLKAAVTEGMKDALTEEKDQPGDYHSKSEKKGFAGERDGQGDETLSKLGDGPAKLETSVYEDDEEEKDFDDIGSSENEEGMEDDDYFADDDGGEEEDELEVDDDFDDDVDDDKLEGHDGEEDDDLDEEDDDDEDEEEDVFEVIEMEDEDEEEFDEGTVVKSLKKANAGLKKENKQYEKALRYLTTKLDEVNLFNARLAYSTKLMRKVALTKEEKENVVERFDECESIREVKRTYKLMNEIWKTKVARKQRVRKNVPSVSTIQEGKEEKNTVLNETASRWQELAGIIQS